jgi:hypothetical protein
MRDWDLTIAFYWPHHRFAIGWDDIAPDEQYDYHTTILYLGFVTITYNY